MKAAQPFPQGMDTHGFGLGALMLAFLVPACVWLVAEAASLAARPGDARRVEFTQAAAGIQGRLQLLRELERRVVASSTSAAKRGYYRERRDEARRRIDELARRAASNAGDAGQQARLEQLTALLQAADSRYARVLALSGGRDAAPRLAMEKR